MVGPGHWLLYDLVETKKQLLPRGGGPLTMERLLRLIKGPFVLPQLLGVPQHHVVGDNCTLEIFNNLALLATISTEAGFR
jgi:hypothetical protein